MNYINRNGVKKMGENMFDTEETNAQDSAGQNLYGQNEAGQNQYGQNEAGQNQ